MSLRASAEVCVVCGAEVPRRRLARALLDGRVLPLCPDHARVVATAKPTTFDELRALFAESAREGTPGRRSRVERRSSAERRLFPRPEGRRLRVGRRADDAL